MQGIDYREHKDYLRKRTGELWRAHDENPPRHLYHYTKCCKMIDIAQSGVLWAQDIKYMSTDDRDLFYMMKVIAPLVEKSSLAEHRKQALMHEACFGLGELWFAYSTSFSSRPDHDSQWKRYANNHTGCCLEFSHEILNHHADEGAYAISRSCYEPTYQCQVIADLLTQNYTWCQSHRINIDSTNAVVNLMRVLLVNGTRFKAPDFSSEDEWRILFFDPDRSFNEANLERGERPRRHVPIQDSIRRILIRPQCHFSVVELRKQLKRTIFAEIPIDFVMS